MGHGQLEEGKMEYTPLISSPVNSNDPPHHKLYWSRWYVLFMFSMLSGTQSCLWISYGAVAETAREKYNVTNSQINFLTATGPIAFIPVSSLTSWAIGEYGLRFACIAGAFLTAAGAVIRCFATADTFWIVILAQFLNAAAGPVVMNAPPALSASWFGVHERTFSTAVGTMVNAVGSAAGFFIGLGISNVHQLTMSLYYEAIVAVALLVGMVVYLPSRPPTPPSNTSSVVRENRSLSVSLTELIRETWQVLKSWDGNMIMLAAGTSAGFSSGWSSMLVILLLPFYSQWDIQWLGVVNIVGSVVGGLAFGKIHDSYRHYKPLILIPYLLAAGVFAVFSLATERIIICSYLEIVALTLAAGFCLGATSPVSYEALAEVTYPVKEEVSAGLLSLTNNIACLVILIIGDYKTGNFINWTMAGICLGCFVFVMLARERYLRSNIDLK